jgi:hypothetical protein
MTERVVHSQGKDSHLGEALKELMRQASQCLSKKNEFHLALSESDSLDDFYARLMFDPDVRMFPWGKTQLWFFGDSTDEDSIQKAFSDHSGIPEEQVHHVSKGLPEGVMIDCCVCNGEDLSEFPDTFSGQCTTWIILSDGDCQASSLGGVTHHFIVEVETE